jgi:dienelactone hydrolase
VRWLRANADSLDLDAAHVGALGFSAGAHLASMLGTGAALALDAAGGSPAAVSRRRRGRRVQAVVSVAGPQDLRVNGPYTPSRRAS